MKLNPRMAYDVLLTSSLEGGDAMLTYAKMIYDSIKLNKKWYQFWFGWKNSPSKILKRMTSKEILETAKKILILEGSNEEGLTFINFHLGLVSESEFMDFLKKNKKKVEQVQSIMK